jgi:hypothetical protein
MKYNPLLGIITVAALVLIATLAFVSSQSMPVAPKLGASGANSFSGAVTNTNAAVSGTSAQVLAGNGFRVYAAIVNDGANVVYLGLGEAAVAGEGIRLNASGGSYEINSQNLYLGAVNAITTSGTSTLTVVEK